MAATAAGLAMALVIGGLIWVDHQWPSGPSTPGAAGRPEVILVAPGDSEVVCAGSLKLPGDGEDAVVYDPRYDPRPSSAESITRGVVAGPDGGRSQELDGGSEATDLPRRGQNLTVVSQEVGEAPVHLSALADPSGEEAPPAAAGATYQNLADGDLRGVAAAACIPEGSGAWIVAGSTETGSSSRLLLTNAGLTSVRADLKLWDGSGPVDAVGLAGLTVPPESQRAVLLEGFIGGASRLAVQVTASGGDLAVFLQHSRLEGLIQGGVELAVPGLAPAKELIVPGLNVTASSFDDARTSALRVLAPGKAAANLNVELWGPLGPVILPGLEDAVIKPGVVTDLSLGGLEAGIYFAVIKSDQPVVAAGLSLRVSGENQPEEFAWTPSTAAAAAQGYVALPEADLTVLLGAGAAKATALELTVIDGRGRAGQSVTVEIAAETTRELSLEDMGGDQNTAAIEFQWNGAPGALALTVSGQGAGESSGEMISAVVPVSIGVSSSEVRVYPARP
jgi:hypothetical protein